MQVFAGTAIIYAVLFATCEGSQPDTTAFQSMVIRLKVSNVRVSREQRWPTGRSHNSTTSGHKRQSPKELPTPH